jgi:hypothetical protein
MSGHLRLLGVAVIKSEHKYTEFNFVQLSSQHYQYIFTRLIVAAIIFHPRQERRLEEGEERRGKNSPRRVLKFLRITRL